MTEYTLTDADREALREPHGPVYEDGELIEALEQADPHRLIAVGDRVVRDIADSPLGLDIGIVDGRIQREAVGDPLDGYAPELELHCDNPAGGVTGEAWSTVREAIAHERTSAVVAEGEEDLLALPAIATASVNSLIVHGHWQEGAVVLRPDPDLKRFVDDLVGYRTHDHVIVGGTWDRFHIGHRYILLAAFEHGEHVDVGIASDAMVREKLGTDDFAPFGARKRQVRDFLDRFGLESWVRTIQIEDFRGNAVEDGDALMVTTDTRDNAERINEERREAGREPLDLIHVDRVTDDDGEVVSSTRLRRGIIDRDGRVR